MVNNKKIGEQIQKNSKLICPIIRTNNHKNKNNTLISVIKRLDLSNVKEVSKDLKREPSFSASKKIDNDFIDNCIYNQSLENVNITDQKEYFCSNEENDDLNEQNNSDDILQMTYFNSKVDEIIDRIIQHRTIKIPNKYKYISDYLFPQIFFWKQNDVVLINCGTGTGKTTLIKKLIENPNIICNILILTNRIANKKQIENELEYLCTYYPKKIVIDSYQSIGKNVLRKSSYLDQFDFIFCDESHFFMSDVDFNQMANSCFDKIMHTTKAIKIFLSATNDDMTKLVIKNYSFNNKIYNELELANRVWIYTLLYNRSNIRKIIKFVNFEEIIKHIKLSDKKWLIFVRSIADGEKYFKQLQEETDKNVVFLHRNNITINNEDACNTLDDLIKLQKFEEDVLISTSIIDNGVNIVDTDLTNIVSFEYDYIELMQEIGRKRCINDSDQFDLYLSNENRKYLLGIERKKKNAMSYFIKTYKDLKSRRTINPIILDGDYNAKMYLNAVYINQHKNAFSFNYLGYYNLKRIINMLSELNVGDNEPFNVKKAWISNKLVNEFEDCNNNVERYIQMIDKYLNIEINKKDTETMIFLSKSFMDHIYKAKHDRPSRAFGITKLEKRFQDFNIPIKIEKNKHTFKLILREVMGDT